MEKKNIQNTEYIVIKAIEDGVNVIGLTRGTDTRFHHSEKLDQGEVMIAQFTEHTSAVKIRGHAKVLTSYGEIISEKKV
ncbi:trp RNA-binding attenuation protein MtrB [Bacillus sp. B15-48]|uniref:trp RNA-binding attenuation protein MtrB n=1 Tax=Bacillus sp. B15-48 TaxID=1548601 RepID=UPI00193ED0D5|nr:trp RNA-binding attenuation protein MtrB [Bacillus sp. B15-48]MBM4762128.1 trp RNA-binding attenuation protein MtrB [Bacillus sp. B15-48]